jgi:hypothetical protein
MSSTFYMGSLAPEVDPLITGEDILTFGEFFRGQGGTGYDTSDAKKIILNLQFDRLTKSEADLLRKYCHATGNSIYSTFVVLDRDRLFDGVTFNDALQRVLNRMKVTSASIIPLRYDEGPDTEQSTGLETATVTLEEI